MIFCLLWHKIFRCQAIEEDLIFILSNFSFIVLLYDQKYQKSFKRIFSPCLGDANQRTACIGSFPACTSYSRKPCVASACGK